MALRLDRLQPANFNSRGMQTLWQRHCEALESNNLDLQAQITAIATAQATANTAITNAATAQTTANTTKRDDKITASWIVPAVVLSASDAGSDATIVVAAHTRLYGDGSQVSVSGHTFTGKAYSTDYGIYYDDTTASDTTPTYHITTTLSNAQNSFVAGRHRVGIITTPAAAGAPTSGGGTPPGGGGDPIDRYSSL